MGKRIADDLNHEKYIEALSRDVAIEILVKLCKDDDLAKRIAVMAKAALSAVDAETVADEVFRNLNSIQVEDLWDNSGKTRWGYQEPTEVAFEMIEDEINWFVRKMELYQSLDMKKEEKEYCKGIIIGLLRYGEDGNNEFRDWAPDDPFTIAENIIYDWKKDHSEDEINEIQAVYNSFFSNEDE